MNQYHSETIDTKRFPAIRPILEAWRTVCKTYLTQVPEDAPWNYHERAHTGFFAAAAWKAGGVALEEWRTDKKNGTGPCRNGRGDLWIQRSGLALHIEAKHTWINIRKERARIEKIIAKFRQARRDASDIPCDGSERKVGVLFAAPVIRHKKLGESEALLKTWTKEMKGLDYLAMALICDVPKSRPESKYVSLGVALFVGDAIDHK
jgi:hypothetical protein